MITGRLAIGPSSGAHIGSLSAWAGIIDAGRELSRELPNASGDACSINAPALAAAECRRALSARACAVPPRTSCAAQHRCFCTSTDSRLRLATEPLGDPGPPPLYGGYADAEGPLELDDLGRLAREWRRLSLATSEQRASSRATSSCQDSGSSNSGRLNGASTRTGEQEAVRDANAPLEGAGTISQQRLLELTCTLLDQQHSVTARALHGGYSERPRTQRGRGAASSPHAAEPCSGTTLADIISSTAVCYGGAGPPADLARSLVAAATAAAQTASWPAAAHMLHGLIQMGTVGTRYLQLTLERIEEIPLVRPPPPVAVTDSGSAKDFRGGLGRGRERGQQPSAAVAGGPAWSLPAHAGLMNPGPSPMDALSLLRSLCAVHTVQGVAGRNIAPAMRRLMQHLRLPLLEALPGPSALLPALQAVTSCGWLHEKDPAFLMRLGDYLSAPAPAPTPPAAEMSAAATPSALLGARQQQQQQQQQLGDGGGLAEAWVTSTGNDADDDVAILMRGPRLLALTPSQLVAVMDAYRRAGVHHSDLMERVLDTVDRCLPSFTSSQATRLAEACARFSHHRPALMRRLALHVGAHLPAAVAPADVAGMVAALARCRVGEDRFLDVAAVWAEEHARAWVEKARVQAAVGQTAVGQEEQAVVGLGAAGQAMGESGVGRIYLASEGGNDAGSSMAAADGSGAGAATSSGLGGQVPGAVSREVLSGDSRTGAGGMAIEATQPPECAADRPGRAAPGSSDALQHLGSSLENVHAQPSVQASSGASRDACSASREATSDLPRAQPEALAGPKGADGGLFDLAALFDPPPPQHPSQQLASQAASASSAEAAAVGVVTPGEGPQAGFTLPESAPQPTSLTPSATVPKTPSTTVLPEAAAAAAPAATRPLRPYQAETVIKLEDVAAGRTRRTALYLSRLPLDLQPHRLLDELLAVPGAAIEMFYMPYNYGSVATGSPGAGCAYLSVSSPEAVAAIYRRLASAPVCGMQKRISVEYSPAPGTGSLLRTLLDVRLGHKAYVDRQQSSTRSRPLLLYVSGSLRGQVQPLDPGDVVMFEWPRTVRRSGAVQSQAALAAAHQLTYAGDVQGPELPDTPAPPPRALSMQPQGEPQQLPLLLHQQQAQAASQQAEVTGAEPLGSELPRQGSRAQEEQQDSSARCSSANTSQPGQYLVARNAQEDDTTAVYPGRCSSAAAALPSQALTDCLSKACALQTVPVAPTAGGHVQQRQQPLTGGPLLSPAHLALMAHSMAALSYHHTGFLHALARLLQLLVVQPVRQCPGLVAAMMPPPADSKGGSDGGEDARGTAAAAAVGDSSSEGCDGSALPLPPLKSVLHALHGVASSPNPDPAAFRHLADACATALRTWLPSDALTEVAYSGSSSISYQACAPDGHSRSTPAAAPASTATAYPTAPRQPSPPSLTALQQPTTPLVQLPPPDVFDIHMKLLGQVLTAAADHSPALHHPDLAAASAALLRRHLPGLKPRAACALLQPLVRFDATAARPLVRAVAPLLVQHPDRLSPPSLVSLAWACAKTGYRGHTRVVTALAIRTEQLLEELPTAAAAQLFWALAVIRPDARSNCEGDQVGTGSAASRSGHRRVAAAAAGAAGVGGGDGDHSLYRVFEGLMRLLLQRYDLTARDLLLVQEGLRLSGSGSSSSGISGPVKPASAAAAATPPAYDSDNAVSSAAMDAFLRELIDRAGQLLPQQQTPLAAAAAAAAARSPTAPRCSVPSSSTGTAVGGPGGRDPSGGVAASDGGDGGGGIAAASSETCTDSAGQLDPAGAEDDVALDQYASCASVSPPSPPGPSPASVLLPWEPGEPAGPGPATKTEQTEGQGTAAAQAAAGRAQAVAGCSYTTGGYVSDPRAGGGGCVYGGSGGAARAPAVRVTTARGSSATGAEDAVAAAALMIQGLLRQIVIARQGLALEETDGLVVRLQVPSAALEARVMRTSAWA